jgi:hypothetical protein
MHFYFNLMRKLIVSNEEIIGDMHRVVGVQVRAMNV